MQSDNIVKLIIAALGFISTLAPIVDRRLPRRQPRDKRYTQRHGTVITLIGAVLLVGVVGWLIMIPTFVTEPKIVIDRPPAEASISSVEATGVGFMVEGIAGGPLVGRRIWIAIVPDQPMDSIYVNKMYIPPEATVVPTKHPVVEGLYIWRINVRIPILEKIGAKFDLSPLLTDERANMDLRRASLRADGLLEEVPKGAESSGRLRTQVTRP